MAVEVPSVESVRMALAELAPADYNPRKIGPKAMAGLKASLTRFGELGGIVFNKRTGHLVGGHQRVKALLQLGETHADVRVVDLPLSEEKAANLALNHPGIGGQWDDALLAVVLDEVKRDLPTAFEELQLDDIIGGGAPGADTGDGAEGDIDYEDGEMMDLPDAPPEAAKVSFALTHEQRATLDAALDAAGSDGSTAGRASALVEVCRAYCP